MHYLVQGDTAAQLKVNLTRNDTGLAADLTDCTIYLKIREKGSTTVVTTLTGSITDLSTAEVVFAFGVDINELAGYYECEVEVVNIVGLIESVYELIQIRVREDF